MANDPVIKLLKRNSGAGGPRSSMYSGEVFLNFVDETVWAGKGDNGAGGATDIVAIGGSGAFLSLSGAQTVPGSKTFNNLLLSSAASNALHPVRKQEFDTAIAALARLDGANFTGTVTAPTPASAENSTVLATTAFVKGQGYRTGNQAVTLSGDATGSGTTAIAVVLKNTGTAGTYAKVTTDAQGRVTAGNQSIVHDDVSDFDTGVRANRLNELAAPAADVSMANRKLTSLADPVNPQDAATKAYVDAARSGLAVKDPVRVATSINVNLASPGASIDGVNLAAGNRVLVRAQTSAAENGVYVWNGAGVPMTRAADADANAEVASGLFVFVSEGASFADNGFVLTTDGPITLGTTALIFSQFSGAGQIDAGAGLVKTGNQLNVVGTANRITAGADAVDIASTYAGQGSITTLGTIVAGIWRGAVVELAYGGTGSNLSALANGVLLKKSGTGLVAAVAGTDYLAGDSIIDCGEG